MQPSASRSRTPFVQPSAKTLVRLATPVILLNLTFVAIQVTDTWMVGRLGSRELAALTPASMAIFVIVSFGYAFLTVVTTHVAQSMGAGKSRSCGHFAWLGVYSAFAIGVLSILLWPIGGLFELFAGSQPGSLGNLEARYFKICLLAMPSVLVTNAVANFYFGVRRPGATLAVSALGLVLNAAISYALIFGGFGLPKLGFDGAAWGTVIATGIEGVALLLWFIVDPKNRPHATFPPPRSLTGLREMWRIGFPSGVQGGVDVLSWGVLLSALIAVHGEAALAASSILMRCMQFTFLPAEGVATIVVALVGNAIGAGRPAGAREHARIAFRINATFMVGAGLIFYLFREPLSLAFTPDPEVLAIVSSCMLFVLLAQWFDAMNLTYLHALQGVGDTRWPSLVTLALSATILGVGGIAAVTVFRPAGGSRPALHRRPRRLLQGALERTALATYQTGH